MVNNRRILVVEDDDALRSTLVEHLAHEYGYAVVEAATLTEADKIIQDEEARLDAIILDIGLPDGDGCDYCVKLRRAGFNLPIIILTGLAGDHDVVRGLSSGANDYISKPFRAAELAARLHAQLRVFDGSEDAVFSVGPYVFRPSKKQLRDSITKQVIRLTNKEVSVLRFLYRSDTGVSRGTLLAQVWGYDSGMTTHTLEAHIYRLRQKIEIDPGHPALLVTEGHRYRLAKNGPPEDDHRA